MSPLTRVSESGTEDLRVPSKFNDPLL